MSLSKRFSKNSLYWSSNKSIFNKNKISYNSHAYFRSYSPNGSGQSPLTYFQRAANGSNGNNNGSINGSSNNSSGSNQLRPFRSNSGGFLAPGKLPSNTIIRFVPQQTAWVVERMGKFHRILQPGLALLIPILDKIQYVQSLKETAINVESQSAITADNVSLELDGVLYLRVFDAYLASYGVENVQYAVMQLAQTTMRSEIGQMTLDHVLRERQSLNSHITLAINEAAKSWGVKVLRYEIRDIHPPQNVIEAMHRLVSAERSKRAEILESEGKRQSAINIAEGEKQSAILASEALKAKEINAAEGEAKAILLRANANSQGIAQLAKSINGTPGGHDAVSLQVAEKYVDAFSQLAKETNTLIVPSSLGDLSGWISSGMEIYKKINSTNSTSINPISTKNASTNTSGKDNL